MIQCQGTPEKTQCLQEATHYAPTVNKNLCDECLHYYMEDASPEEQSSIIELTEYLSGPSNMEHSVDTTLSFKEIVESFGAPSKMSVLRGNLMKPNPHQNTRIIFTCYVFDWMPSVYNFNGTIYQYQPPHPFRLKGLLIWEPNGEITSIKVANQEQLVMHEGVPMNLYAPPNVKLDGSTLTLEHAKQLVEWQGIEDFLPQHLKGMMIPTCNSDQCIEVGIKGQFKHMMLWGLEHNGK